MSAAPATLRGRRFLRGPARRHASNLVEDDILLQADFPVRLVRLSAGVHRDFIAGRASARCGDGVTILVGPVVMAFVGYVIFKKLIFDLVDEVFDAGDSRWSGTGPRKTISHCPTLINVNCAPMMEVPRRARRFVSLRRASMFEARSRSARRCVSCRLRSSPVIDELIARDRMPREAGNHDARDQHRCGSDQFVDQRVRRLRGRRRRGRRLVHRILDAEGAPAAASALALRLA